MSKYAIQWRNGEREGRENGAKTANLLRTLQFHFVRKSNALDKINYNFFEQRTIHNSLSTRPTFLRNYPTSWSWLNSVTNIQFWPWILISFCVFCDALLRCRETNSERLKYKPTIFLSIGYSVFFRSIFFLLPRLLSTFRSKRWIVLRQMWAASQWSHITISSTATIQSSRLSCQAFEPNFSVSFAVQICVSSLPLFLLLLAFRFFVDLSSLLSVGFACTLWCQSIMALFFHSPNFF